MRKIIKMRKYILIKTAHLDLGYIMGFLNEEKQLIVENNPDKRLVQFMPRLPDEFEPFYPSLKMSKNLIISEPLEYAGQWKYVGRINEGSSTYPPFIFENITND